MSSAIDRLPIEEIPSISSVIEQLPTASSAMEPLSMSSGCKCPNPSNNCDHKCRVPPTAKICDLRPDIIDPNKVDSKGLATDQGVYISDTDNWLQATNRDRHGKERPGPALLEDQIAREKIMRFDHERIPERVVHARGAGAHGYFKLCSEAAKKYTDAPVLTDITRTTSTFVRFSTVQGSRGSADTVRDVRGFATKFYTPEGNWDIVGNNIPVFFIQDAIKFPDIIHAVKPQPQNEVPQGQSAHNNFWDFVGLQPESAHMIMWVMSDRGIPRSYRMMEGFGVNTFILTKGDTPETLERHFVKFHWIPELGVHSLTWDEALKINGQDPDFHRKDLEAAIKDCVFPKWYFGIQAICEKDEHMFDFDILDATKVWPEHRVPVEIIGEMVLNRNVTEFFPEVEQIAFCTANVVPGIGFSDDPLLQGRNFSYLDTQISRLGINWQQLPINRPICPVLNNHRDGAMQHRIHKGLNYWPNRHGHPAPVPGPKGGYIEYPQKWEAIKQRLRSKKFQEHFNQAREFVHNLSKIGRKHLIAALSFELSHCDEKIVYNTYINILAKIDWCLAKRVAINVGGVVPPRPDGWCPCHCKDKCCDDTPCHCGGKCSKCNADPCHCHKCGCVDPPKPPCDETGNPCGGGRCTIPPLICGCGCPDPTNCGCKKPEPHPKCCVPCQVPTIKSRRIAILVADGFNLDEVNALREAFRERQATTWIIGPRRGLVCPAGRDGGLGKGIRADFDWQGQRSTLYDAVIVPGGEKHVHALAKSGRAIHWVREAFGHSKPIGALGAGIVFLRDDAKLPGVQFAAFPSRASFVSSYGVITSPHYTQQFLRSFVAALARHRCWERELAGFVAEVAF